jgi:lipid-binding SYLF domain-containing protein
MFISNWSIFMRSTVLFAALFIVTAFTLNGCSTEPKSEGAKVDLHNDVNTALDHFKRQDPGLGDLLSKSVGYVMFPGVGKGGAIVGGAYGHGEVYEGNNMIGFADMRQASVGLQLGGQEYTELVVFNTPEAFSKFKLSQLEFGANASAVALKAGASSAAKFVDGVAVFTQQKGGLMFEASLTGQKFTFQSTPAK